MLKNFLKRKKSPSAEEYVSSLYHNILKRAPDEAGFAAHVAYLKRGGEAKSVFKTFVTSEEYLNLTARNSQQGAQGHTREQIVPYEEADASLVGLEMVIAASRNHYSDRAFIKSLENLPSLVGR